jgi:hypothetical protein
LEVLVSFIVHSIGAMAILAMFSFSVGITAGSVMAITGTRNPCPLVLHRSGMWTAKWLLTFLVILVVIAEIVWRSTANTHRVPMSIFVPHIVSIALFLGFFFLAQKNNGRRGMRIHLSFAIPCAISFFGMFATGWMLYERIPR